MSTRKRLRRVERNEEEEGIEGGNREDSPSSAGQFVPVRVSVFATSQKLKA